MSRDLFISYAHIDNAAPASMTSGWVDHLQKYLQHRLAQLLGEPPAIWRDRSELKGNDIFHETIGIGLRETRAFLSVLSPRYLKSKSCWEELQGFLSAAGQSGGVHIGEKHRIFKVIKTHIELHEHPEELQGLLGYEFYAKDPITGRFREFDPEIGPNREKDKRYWEKADDLAQDICDLLKRLQGEPTAPAKPAATIFLAETTSDLDAHRDNVRRELRQVGHVVLPEQPLPKSRPTLEQLVRGCLAQSRMSVHLIGADYGFVPEQEPERSVVWLQQDLARERATAGDFARLIWLPPGLRPRDDRQAKFIETLRNSAPASKGTDLIEAGIENLKTIIDARLNPPLTPAPSPDDGLTRVYLVCDARDLDAIEPLYKHLYDEGCEVLLPATDESALLSHKQNMLDCDGVLFYYASPPEIWLRTHVRQLTGFGRTRPFKAVAAFLTGDETPQKKLFQSREVDVLRNFGEFDPAILREFLGKVKGGAR